MSSWLPLLSLNHVTSSANAAAPGAVHDLSCDIAPGELLSLIGPPGAGKTRLLQLIAGVTLPDTGAILLNGAPMTRAPLHRRRIAAVFPDHRLIPGMSLADMLTGPLHMRGIPAADHPAHIATLLTLIGLPDGADPHPPAQRPRALLARALATNPTLLLLDNFFAGLDRATRQTLAHDLRALHRHLGITIIHATHDHAEALSLSDRIAVLAAGTLRQLDTPQAVYDTPASALVATFLGDNNALAGIVETIEDDLATIRLACGPVIEALPIDVTPGDLCVVTIRPERIAAAPLPPEDMGESALPATFAALHFHGDHQQLHLRLGAPPAPLLVKRPAGLPLQAFAPDEPASVAWRPHDARAYPR
jgi:ABC-type Fe3+/spermidine/putrescine transport system ATPase subunit